MKKLASILGIGVISAAVALAPAFAEQTKPMDQASSATVQSAPDVKTPAVNQAGKDEKNLPSKSGTGTQAGQVTSAKTGSDVKTGTVSGKPAADVKTGSAPAKTDTAVKETKSTEVKSDANLQNNTAAKSAADTKSVATPKHHVRKSVEKPASTTHAKANVSGSSTVKAAEKSSASVPSTEK